MTLSIAAADVKTIIIACEAGMGSSLMVVNALKKKIKAAKIAGITVVHSPAREVPEDAALVVVHKGLSKLVRSRAQKAVLVTFDHFFGDPAFDKLITALVDNGTIESTVE